MPGQFVIGEGNVVRLPAATTTVTASNVGNLEKLSAEAVKRYADSFSITDRGVSRGAADAGTLEFQTPAYVGRSGANALLWRVPITGSAAAGTSHSRVATITLGSAPAEATYAVEYTVTTKPAAAAQWTVRGSADTWTVSWDDPIQARVYGLVIENQDDRLSNVRLVLSTLKDASGHALGLDHMRLVRAPTDGKALQNLEVAPQTAEPVFIQIHEDADLFGTYDGVLRFTADGSSALKDLQLKVQLSSPSRKLLGFLLTMLGLLLAMVVAAVLRPQIVRLQARRATAALRHSLSEFVAEVDRTIPAQAPTATMKRTATHLSTSLSDTALHLLLPPAFALPGAEAAAELPAGLKTVIEEASARTEALFVLLRSGAPKLVALLEQDPAQAIRLLGELDDAAATVKNRTEAATTVDTIHAKIQVPPGIATASLPSSRRTEVEELDLSVRALSFAAWSVWLIVALATAAAWIAGDVDYGTTGDLVSSLLWGFGITAFGASVQNLTPAQIATQVKVNVPK